jgi:hypothetical protein
MSRSKQLTTKDMMMKRIKAKSIKTNAYRTGNQYGQITKGSKIHSEYGIQLPCGVICRNYFLTARGARFAADCVNAGLPIAALDCLNADDLAACIICPKSQRKEAWASAVADAVTKSLK